MEEDCGVFVFSRVRVEGGFEDRGGVESADDGGDFGREGGFGGAHKGGGEGAEME